MTDTTQEKISLQRISKLKIVLSLSSSYFAAAVITVIFTGSLALLSEAGHMLVDVAGLELALFAITYTRKPPTPQKNLRFL